MLLLHLMRPDTIWLRPNTIRSKGIHLHLMRPNTISSEWYLVSSPATLDETQSQKMRPNSSRR